MKQASIAYQKDAVRLLMEAGGGLIYKRGTSEVKETAKCTTHLFTKNCLHKNLCIFNTKAFDQVILEKI